MRRGKGHQRSLFYIVDELTGDTKVHYGINKTYTNTTILNNAKLKYKNNILEL